MRNHIFRGVVIYVNKCKFYIYVHISQKRFQKSEIIKFVLTIYTVNSYLCQDSDQLISPILQQQFCGHLEIYW